ncbi:MAG TPA: hypothetical protein VJV79_29965 [Polyangiaceae bacterium]|nr:hypothetical protein [Polyangiaceae bacterium]
MRLRTHHEDLASKNLPYQVIERLEASLSLWKSPAPWQKNHDYDSPLASEADFKVWADVVARAYVVDPVSTTSGVLDAVRRHNLMSDPEDQWSLEGLEEKGMVMIRGARAEVRSSIGYSGATVSSGHSWHLSVPYDDDDDIEEERFVRVCQAAFAVVEQLPAELSVGEPRPIVAHTANLLAAQASGATAGTQLTRFWRKATAFGVDREWIERLDAIQRRTLADALSQTLTSVAAELGWEQDLEFTAFHSNRGKATAAKPRKFATRTDECFWARFILEHSRDGLAPKFAFGQMAAAVVLAGNSTQIGNLLGALPPGRAYFAAIEALRTWRPVLIASLLSHPAFASHAIVAITDWPDARVVQGHGSMRMDDEWLELTTLARRLALFHQQGPDYGAALALAAHDEVRDSVVRQNPYGRSPVPPLAKRLEPWTERLGDPDHAGRAAKAIVNRLRADPNDSDLVVALRLLGILEKSHGGAAHDVAVAIVDAYTARVSLADGRRRAAPQLAAHGDLLSVLERVLSAHAPDKLAIWRMPFDLLELVERAKEPLPDSINSDTSTPRIDVPVIVHAHASNLLSAAAYAEAGDAAGVEVFVQLFERTHTKLELDAWSWNQRRVEEGSSPLMVRFGRELLRMREGKAAEFVERIVDAGASTLHLAELIWGMGSASSLGTGLKGRARRAAQAELAAQAISRGHGNAVGGAFYNAGLPDIAEQYASYVLATLVGESPHHVTQIRDAAVRILLGAWTAQKKWSELENAGGLFSDFGGRELVENLQAVAELEQGKADQALQRLTRILQRNPGEEMALANKAAAHAERGEWQACLVACEHARTVLQDSVPVEVNANEARAYYNLRRFRDAAAALERLPDDLLRSASVMTLRVALATATAPTVSGLDEDLKVLARTDPSTAGVLRARLAPLSDADIGGAWYSSGGLDRRFPTFEERCIAFAETPERLLLNALAGSAQRIAEQPALAQDLNEDQLTRMFCAMLITLERVRLYAHVFAPGGWGPKKEGLADFALSEMGDQGLAHGRRIIRGEAKLWRGSAWMEDGMRQIFGTSNTGQELFLCLVIYSRLSDFGVAVSGALDSLKEFGANAPTPYRTVGDPEEVTLTAGSAVRVFKTLHCERPEIAGPPPRTLLTIVVDIASGASREVRLDAGPEVAAS